MPRFLLAFLLLAHPLGAQATRTAAVPDVPARRAFAHQRHIRMELHAPSGWTIVELSPMALEPAGRTELRTSFRFKGEVPASTPATLTFAIIGRGAGEVFALKPTLSLVLDGGKPIVVPATRFARPVAGGSTETTVYATMARATFLRLTSASLAEVRVDDASWTLSHDMLEALRDLASRMSPAGFKAARAQVGMVAALPATGGDSSALPLYTASEVDTPIRPRGLLARPPFPAGASRLKRRVMIRYVVDTTGAVELPTLRGESPVADSAFVASVRSVADRWRFVAARKGGRAVRMEIRQAIEFVPLAGDIR